MSQAADDHPFDRITEADLRRRQSAKWRFYPEDVLPSWVAEMDYPIAESIKRVVHEAVDVDDAGYADPRGLGDAFVPFARERWGWSDIAPSDVMVAPDVVTAICELLLVTTREGDGVVIDPPVYFPFAESVQRLHRRLLPAPLVRIDGRYRMNLEAIERAYTSGAKVHLLCSPHNPTGMVPTAEELGRVAELADRYDVLVLSDEIHAPMTHEGAVHRPFPTISDFARRRSIVLTSASKTWNLPGLKASVMVATSDAPRAMMRRVPHTLPFHAGHLGVLAARVAWASEGRGWLDDTMRILDRNRRLLTGLLAEHLPKARYSPPEAGYLAWIDCRELGLGDDPAKAFLDKGRVALSSGPMFGEGGEGFARLNLATTRLLLEEAVLRMTRALR